nr:fibronectin type III domain-containing protein [uncultured Arsenicibacter sp.]
MRTLLLFLCLVLGTISGMAQPSVSFTRLPQDLQLYPRNDQNQAEVIISGQVNDPGFRQIEVSVLKEGNFWKSASQSIPEGGGSQFRIPVTIQAEPAEYTFQVYVRRDNESVLVTERKRIVCGDVYILYGQSNALGLAGLDDYQLDDRLLRNVSYPYGSANIPAEMRWYTAREPFGSVGMLGMEIQRHILQQYGIPTLVINGGIGGASILELGNRTPSNHADYSNYYGSLLYRAQWAGVADKVKAIIYKQGENEAGGEPDGYANKFRTFYNQLREDYGQNPKIYIGQINIMTPSVSGAGDLRDFQRRTPQLFPNLAAVATVGAVGYDGLHYEPRANQQLAFEQFRLIARDIYGSSDTQQINSPDIKKIAYNERRDELTLTFDDDMQMVWPPDSTIYNPLTGNQVTRRMADFIYLDEQPGLIRSGRAEGNRIILTLTSPQTARTATYLPPFYSTAELPFYQGPYLRNSRGMRAFSFSKVAIDAVPVIVTPPAAPGNLVASAGSPAMITLTWQDNADNEAGFEIEQQQADGSFRRIATPAANSQSFQVTGLAEQTGYSFRIRAVNSIGASAYTNTASASTPASIPLQPQGLTATAIFSNSVNLSWTDRAFNETGYEIEQSTTGQSFTRVAALSPGSTTYVAANLTENTTYIFRVRAVNSAGASAWSNTLPVTTPISVPLTPGSLTAVAATPSSLTLAWQDAAFNETAYEVEQATPGQSFTRVASLTANVASFSLAGLTETTTYLFRVRAVNSAGASPYSNTLTVTTPATLPAAPTNLTAGAFTPTSISLVWSDNAFNETGYDIEQSTGSGEYQKVATVPPNSTTYISSGLTEATLYRFRVRAVNSAGGSAYSNIAQSLPLILGVEDLTGSLRIYPNPVRTGQYLQVEHDQPIFTGFDVYTIDGRVLSSGQQKASRTLSVPLVQAAAGRYIVHLRTTSGQPIRKHILVY